MPSILPDPVIILAPMEDVPPETVNAAAQEIERIFGFPFQVMPLLKDLKFAYNPQRRQYHSTPILDRLAAKAPPQALKVLGLVNVDLFIPILTHVYGEAQLGGRAALVSIFRLKTGLPSPEPEKAFLARVVKEVVHELGHTFDLRHCPDPHCIMHYCRSEKDVDRKSDQLCRYCRIFVADERRKIKA